MGRIKILHPNIANQIAAGEVIERPASVVKELIENALDAGAARIAVSVEGGGRDSILVKDDGIGMDRADIELAVEPHATSKIASEQDLAAIKTLGFRGEALASMGSVSRFTIVSREQSAASGWELTMSFGRDKQIRPKGCPPGTSVRVEELFGQIPARRKFLKSPQTELGHISQVVRTYAVSNPHIYFELVSQGRTLFKSKRGLSGSQALWPLVGEDAAARLLEFDGKGSWFNVKGFISSPEDARASGKAFYFFVNKRHVKDRMLWKALSEACRGLFVKGAHPLGAVFIDAEPEYVDVNCHPAKQEVRFRDANSIFRAIYHGIRRALEKRSHPLNSQPLSIQTPSSEILSSQRPSGRTDAGASSVEKSKPYAEQEPIPLEVHEPAAVRSQGYSQPVEGSSTITPFKLIGQLAATYLLFEGPEGLVMVDQHAAHEALLFKKIMEQIEAGGQIVSQSLAFPIVLERRADQLSKLVGCVSLFEKLGLKVEPFGTTEIVIHEIPEIVAMRSDKAKAVADIIDTALERGCNDLRSLLWDMAAMVACRCAVKADDDLRPQEMVKLMQDLMAEGVTNCPHGRPVVVSVTLDEIKKRFKR